MAVIWSVSRLKHYLSGRYFVIQTDHQPLITLFGANKGIPTSTSARIYRWAIELMRYDYTIKYVSGPCIPHADALSRLRFSSNDEDPEVVTAIINCVQFEPPVLDQSLVKRELESDGLMMRVMQRVVSGVWTNCSEVEKPFLVNSSRLTVYDDMLYWGAKLFIP